MVEKHALRLESLVTRLCSRFSARGLARLLVAALPSPLADVTVTYGPGHDIGSVDDVRTAVAEVMEESADRKDLFALDVNATVPFIAVTVSITRFRSKPVTSTLW